MYVSVCVHVVCMCVGQSQCQVSSLLSVLLFETESLLNLELADLVGLAGQRAPVILLPLPLQGRDR